MTQNKHRSPLAVLSDDQLCPSHSGSQATEQFERYYTQHIGSHLEDVANRSDWSSLLGDLDHLSTSASTPLVVPMSESPRLRRRRILNIILDAERLDTAAAADKDPLHPVQSCVTQAPSIDRDHQNRLLGVLSDPEKQIDVDGLSFRPGQPKTSIRQDVIRFLGVTMIMTALYWQYHMWRA